VILRLTDANLKTLHIKVDTLAVSYGLALPVLATIIEGKTEVDDED
jgi:hypothetical protein